MNELKQWFVDVQTKMDLVTARKLFHSVSHRPTLKDHSREFCERLQPWHRLVVSPDFESGVCKLIVNASEDLDVEEQEACECLLRTKFPNLCDVDQQQGPSSDDESVQSPRKFRKTLHSKSAPDKRRFQSRHIDNLDWMSPATVDAECLFSKCSRVMTADRRKMVPRLFESIVCLRQNKDWWDINTAQQMISGEFDSQLKEMCGEHDTTIPEKDGNNGNNEEEEDSDDEW